MRKVDRSQQIKNAITWYRREKSLIVASLPLTTEGITFKVSWIRTIEKNIGLYESGKFKQTLGVSYLVNPLKKIRRFLNA